MSVDFFAMCDFPVHETTYKFENSPSTGLFLWLSDKGSACQCRSYGSIPGPGRPHVLQRGSWKQEKPLQWETLALQLESSPLSPQLKKACTATKTHTAKNKQINEIINKLSLHRGLLSSCPLPFAKHSLWQCRWVHAPSRSYQSPFQEIIERLQSFFLNLNCWTGLWNSGSSDR